MNDNKTKTQEQLLNVSVKAGFFYEFYTPMSKDELEEVKEFEFKLEQLWNIESEISKGLKVKQPFGRPIDNHKLDKLIDEIDKEVEEFREQMTIERTLYLVDFRNTDKQA